eukprot:NODE_170_length_14437_cov_1.447273.p6 type:complete len:295 gc:universal NODE_170_length_14437_cov_1.447273:12930-12046(-)
MSVDHYQTLGIMTKISSSFSIIGSVVILYRFYVSDSSDKRNLSKKIIVYMSLLDFACSIMFFIGPWFFDNQYLCSLEGFFIQMTVGAPLWNMAHSTNILLRVVFGYSVRKANKLEPLYHIFAWGIPITGALVGLIRKSMLPVGGWCWLSPRDVDLRFATFYGWVFIAILYNITIALIVLIFINKSQKISGFKLSRRTLKSAKNQLFYVYMMLLVFGPSAITRIVQTATGNEVFWLQIIQAFTLPLQGFLNCLVYLTIQKVIFKSFGQDSPVTSAKSSYQIISGETRDNLVNEQV